MRTMKTVLRANFPDVVFGNSVVAEAAALETSLTATTGRTPNVMFRIHNFVLDANTNVLAMFCIVKLNARLNLPLWLNWLLYPGPKITTPKIY